MKGDYYCYFLCCGISVVYDNSCQCPNNCYSSREFGTCGSSGCTCTKRGGRDCYSIKCPSDCGGGTCVVGNSSFPDHCLCPDGKTGVDCSVEINSQLTFNMFPPVFKAQTYYKDDEYKDEHPIFNLSVIGMIKITMKEEDLVSMLKPANTFNQSYFSSSFVFDNGNLKTIKENVGIKVKGFIQSRLFPKKAYNLKFNLIKGEDWMGLKGVGLKKLDDTMKMTDTLVTSLNRASGVQTYRASYVVLYINDVFFGLYWMHENLDDLFLQSRFKDKSGNLYKGNMGCLNYLGDDPSVYQELSVTIPFVPGFSKSVYSQEEGDGNWSDFVSLLQTINETDIETFASEIEGLVDLDSLFRVTALNNLVGNWDDMAGMCNNWLMYKDPSIGKFVWISHDVTNSLTFSPVANCCTYDTDPFRHSPDSVLFVRLWSILRFRERYLSIYSEIFNTLMKPNLDHLFVMLDMLYPYLDQLDRDDFVAKYTDSGVMSEAMNRSKEWLEQRQMYLMKEFFPNFDLVNFIPFWVGLGAALIFIIYVFHVLTQNHSDSHTYQTL
eukprot:TRINITY_DN6229_c0_g1_i9.p1 TRINITY_DN6229_c0_g1~~TRINITY_DN6229_c0_g1_i9.p1  ORF type:complete len:549 (-),score=89.18 TRINITY_DN6229_c0_g1_i9:78-1724(-)